MIEHLEGTHETVNYWKNTARFKANKIWTADDNVMCGYVAKGGFVRGTWSGIYRR